GRRDALAIDVGQLQRRLGVLDRLLFFLRRGTTLGLFSRGRPLGLLVGGALGIGIGLALGLFSGGNALGVFLRSVGIGLALGLVRSGDTFGFLGGGAGLGFVGGDRPPLLFHRRRGPPPLEAGARGSGVMAVGEAPEEQ